MDLLKSLFSKQTRLTNLKQPLTAEQLFKIFDIFYICFDEPNRKVNWQQIKNILPQANKVESVIGFDNALKACAKQSATEYFFVIDGDNQLVERNFKQPLVIEDVKDHWVLSWASLNPVNGLTYGNGGVKLWPKEVALAIKSHENAPDGEDQTDYCFIASYYLIDNFISKTIINSHYRQAFRSGFREGVKMSLAYGKRVNFKEVDFESALGRQNRLRLKVWCEVGADALHGLWAVLGARMGLYFNCLEDFDYRLINSYGWIESLLEKEVFLPLGINEEMMAKNEFDEQRLTVLIESYGKKISNILPLRLELLTSAESLEFKENFQNPQRSGLLN